MTELEEFHKTKADVDAIEKKWDEETGTPIDYNPDKWYSRAIIPIGKEWTEEINKKALALLPQQMREIKDLQDQIDPLWIKTNNLEIHPEQVCHKITAWFTTYMKMIHQIKKTL